jgi:hypothetical protein
MPSISMPVMPGGMPGDPSMSSQPAREPHGITLTTRQLVGMLVMTALLAGVIGALVTLLVLQRNQTPGEGPATQLADASVPETKRPTVAQTPTPSTDTRPVGAVDKPAGTGAVQTPVVPVTAKPATSLYILRGETRLPPLRALSEPPVGPPKQSQWTRPGGPPATPAPAAPTTVAPTAPKPGVPAAAAPAAAKPAVPAATPAAATPAAKPATPDAKRPAGEPGKEGLRNPFSR